MKQANPVKKREMGEEEARLGADWARRARSGNRAIVSILTETGLRT